MLTTTLLLSVPAAHKCDQKAETGLCSAIQMSTSKDQAAQVMGYNRCREESERWHIHTGHHWASTYVQ